MAGIWDDISKDYFNPEKQADPGFWSSFPRVAGQLVQGAGSTLRDLGAQDVGQSIEEYGAGVVRRNPSGVNSLADVVESPWLTTREAVGEAVGQGGAMLGAGLAGRYVGGLVGGLAGPVGAIVGQQVGATVGGLLPIATQTYGGIRVKQREQGINDVGRAVEATVPAVALERLGGAERVVGGLLRSGTSGLAREAGDKLLPHMGRQALRGGLEEFATEVPQTALERYGAYENLNSADAWNDYAVSGIKGALGGAGIRGGAAGLAGVAPAPVRPKIEDQPNLLDRATQTEYPIALRQENLPAAPDIEVIDPVVEQPVSFAESPIGLPAPQEAVPQADPNALVVTPAGTVARMGALTGQQYDMFGGPDTFGESDPVQVEQPQQVYPDTSTRDMFAETPSAMVPTMFNPETDTSVGQPNAASTKSIGAVASNIRSQLAQQLGATDAYSTKLAFGLAQNIDSVETATSWLDTQSAKLDKEQRKMDDDADNDVLSPEEYAAKREQLENRRLALVAAEELVARMRKARQDALVQEARGKSRPGVVVGQPPQNDVSVQQMREKNDSNRFESNLETTDAKVADGMRAKSGNERADILRSVLDQNPPAGQVLMRFNQALRSAGFTKLANAEEVSTLKAYLNTVKENAPETELPVVPSAPNEMDVYEPPRKAKQPNAKAKPQSSVQPATSAPAPVGDQLAAAEAKTPVNEAAKRPKPKAQPAASTAQPTTVATKVTPPAQAVDNTAEGSGATQTTQEAPTEQQLIDNIENAKDAKAYQDALDAMHEVYDGESTPVLDKWLDEQLNAKKKGNAQFRKDVDASLSRVEKKMARAERKRNQAEPESTEKTDEQKALDDIGNALAKFAGKFRTNRGDAKTGSIGKERALEIVQKVLRSLGITDAVDIQVVGKPEDIGVSNPGAAGAYGVTLDNGRIVLFADNLTSDIEAFKTIFHELFHLGLSKTLGQGSYIQSMLKFKTDALVRQYAERWKKSEEGQAKKGTMPTNNYEALAVEEALADIGEALSLGNLGSKELKPFVRSAVQALASVADAFGLKPVAQAIRRMSYTQAEKFVVDTIASSGAESAATLRPNRFRPGTSAFAKWFGDSKVVDADGKPLVVYHGTPLDLNEIKSEYGSNGGEFANRGIYFSPDAGYAGQYAKYDKKSDVAARKENAGGVLYPVYLSIQNPLVFTWKDSYNTAAFSKKLKQMGATALAREFESSLGSMHISKPMMAELESIGFDGIINERWNEYVAFKPTQIKSAIGNNGNFDPANPDIRFRTARESMPKGVYDPLAELKDRFDDVRKGWRYTPELLGFLSLDQIADRFPEMTNVQNAIRGIQRMGARMRSFVEMPADLRKQWSALHRADQEMTGKLNRLFVDTTRLEVWVDGKYDNPMLDKRNAHLKTDDKAEMAKITQEAMRLRADWNSLSPAHQKLYGDVLAELRKQFDAKQNALLKRIIDGYKDDLVNVASPEELAELARLPENERDVQKFALKQGASFKDGQTLSQFLADVDTNFVKPSEVPGPYFPLTRRGKFVMVKKGADFKKLEAALEAAHTKFGEVYGRTVNSIEDQEAHRKELAEAKKALGEARKKLNDAKSNADQYIVKFFDSRTRAEREAVALGADPAEAVFARQEFFNGMDTVSPALVNRLSNTIGKQLGTEVSGDVAKAVRQFLISALPDRSQMKNEMQRMKVEGVDAAEAMHSFLEASHKNAWVIARLENSVALADALHNARAASKDDERIVGNEMAKRFAKQMEHTENNALVDMAANASHMSFLGMSIGYYVQNALQPWIVTLPWLAARYGMRRSGAEIAKATGEVAKALKLAYAGGSLQKLSTRLDYSLFDKGNGEQQMLRDMLEEGLIDITIRADKGGMFSQSDNKLAMGLETLSDAVAFPPHMVEVVNRISTALAAYRMAMDTNKGKMDYAAAVTASRLYAERALQQTQVDYTTENAPRFMNPNMMGGLGRLAFQFKRYQQAMAFLWAKTAIEAYREVKAGKADKENLRMLAYMSGMTLGTSGLAGLPVAGPAGLLLWAFSKMDDDDEEKDLAQLFYAGMKEYAGEAVADAVRYGLPTTVGVNLSAKLGFGQTYDTGMLEKVKRADNGQEMVGALAAMLFGPTGGMVSNWVDAMSTVGDDPVKSISKIMPVGIKNAVEAGMRAYGDGLTDRKGNVLLTPEEQNTLGLLAKSIGFGESTEVKSMYDARSAMLESEAKVKTVRDKLLRKAVKAREKGEGMQDAMDEIAAFNERQPANRILPKHIVASWKQERIRQKEMVSGVRVRERSAGLADAYGLTSN